jgi:putative membrane protein
VSARAAFVSLFVAQVAAQVAYGARPPRRPARATRRLLLLMLATSVADAVQARGWRRGVPPVAAAGAIGLAAELVGVATGRPFGPYRYSEKLGPRVAGVPPLAAAAWALMARPAWAIAGRLSPRTGSRVVLAAGALTAWDVFVDPRMARDGYWTWPGGGRYEGVPLSNFGGWLATSLVVFAAWSRLDPDERTPRDGGAIALYAWSWIGETFAHAVLWRRPRVAVAGGLAMGAFALPALVRGR